MKPEVRIIGGQYRGKKLHFPDIEGLRPTPNRVRETLFNWLMNHIRGAICLDAFAGSGALGLEAYSRGAQEIYFIEQHALTYAHLQKVILTFNSPHLKLLHNDAINFILHSSQRFDIIFLDPPFQSNLLPLTLDTIATSNILQPGGFVYIESSDTIIPNPLQWTVLKQNKAGIVFYALLVRNDVKSG